MFQEYQDISPVTMGAICLPHPITREVVTVRIPGLSRTTQRIQHLSSYRRDGGRIMPAPGSESYTYNGEYLNPDIGNMLVDVAAEYGGDTFPPFVPVGEASKRSYGGFNSWQEARENITEFFRNA